MKARRSPRFRIVSVLAVMLMLGSATVAAQPGQRMQDPEQRLEHMMTHLTSVLKLTDEQVPEVREILREQIARQQELFEARRAGEMEQRQAMRTEMEKWREETDARMSEVLTDEQTEQYKQYMKDNRRGPRGERGSHRGPRDRRG